MLESGIKWFGAKIEQSNDMYFHELPVSTSLSFIAKDDTGLISVSEFASIISTIVPGTGLSGTGLSEMRDVTLNVDASIPEITTLAGLTSFGSAGATTNILAGDIDWYNPVTNGNPILKMGVDASESLQIKAFYQSGTQSMQLAQFITKTESTTADDGRFTFHPDEVKVLSIDDGGIDFEANMGISIDGTDILTDSSGTATLSNIDALDATTIATFETAMEANLDTFGSQMTSASSLASVGTITSGAWQGDVIASAYLDADTAHLSGVQSFTGAKSFSEINKAKFGGNKTVIPGDGAVIHVDAHTVTDGATSGSGTAALYTHVNIEAPALLATQESVTTTAAASLYIKDAPSASTNQTITNAYALWVDAGLVKFDGDLTVGGTITGDVTGAATTAGTVTTAAQPAIESIGTDGDTLSILGDTLSMANATTNKPEIKLTNNTDDATGSFLTFLNQRADSGIQAGEDDDVIGTIQFQGYNDGTPALKNYSKIYSDIHDATSGEESGRLTFQVANHDGGMGSGLILTGGSADDEIDVTVGLGAASVVTIPGDLTVNGDTVTFESANADDPTVIIKNTTADAQGARLQMTKDRGAAMVQGDRVGEIDFIGEDAGEAYQQYGKIFVRADVVTAGQESGQMIMQVANHDGGLEAGLVLEGGSENSEIDAIIGLGANSVVTIPGSIQPGTVVASAYLDADTMHYSAQRQVTHHYIKDDIGTGVIYISLGQLDAENAGATNKNLPLLAPTAGKLLKVFLRTTNDMSGTGYDTNLTWRLYARTTSSTTAGASSEIGAQTGAGPTNKTMVTYDFTSSLDSGTNVIAAGDKVLLSIQSDATSADTQFFITCMWEWDLS